jgi:hypothetical protein
MAWSVYRQPDTEHYSIWDSVSDSFIYTDCTAEDIRAIYKEEFGRSAELATEHNLEMADGTRKRYFDRGTYAELLARQSEQHAGTFDDPYPL